MGPVTYAWTVTCPYRPVCRPVGGTSQTLFFPQRRARTLAGLGGSCVIPASCYTLPWESHPLPIHWTRSLFLWPMPASPTFSELRERERNLKNLLDQARRLSAGRGDPRGHGIEDFRARDSQRKRESLEARKALYIPKPQNLAHRKLLESDVFEWLRWYFGADAGPGADIFTEPFQRHHIEMIQAIEDATVHAGDQAIAAPRGEGKSTIAECVTIYNILKGKVTVRGATCGDGQRCHQFARLDEAVHRAFRPSAG